MNQAIFLVSAWILTSKNTQTPPLPLRSIFSFCKEIIDQTRRGVAYKPNLLLWVIGQQGLRSWKGLWIIPGRVLRSLMQRWGTTEILHTCTQRPSFEHYNFDASVTYMAKICRPFLDWRKRGHPTALFKYRRKRFPSLNTRVNISSSRRHWVNEVGKTTNEYVSRYSNWRLAKIGKCTRPLLHDSRHWSPRRWLRKAIPRKKWLGGICSIFPPALFMRVLGENFG